MPESPTLTTIPTTLGFAFYRSHIGPVDDRYMLRWILRVPGGYTLRAHRILRPDASRDLHDHPFWLTSLVLRGGYVEERPDAHGRALVEHRFGAVNRIPAERPHTIRVVHPNTWTLVLAGPLVRDWGYHTPTGWVDHNTYLEGRA